MATDLAPLEAALLAGIKDNATNDLSGVVDILIYGLVKNYDKDNLEAFLSLGTARPLYKPSNNEQLLEYLLSLPPSEGRSDIFDALVLLGVKP